MKRTAIVITLGIILLAAGYLAYEKWYERAPGTLWDNVPGNAVLVFESKKTVDSWNKLNAMPLWNSLEAIPSFKKIKDHLQLLDSIDGQSGGMAALLQDNSLISLHVTSKNDFDWLYYIDMSTENSQRIASKILDYFKSSPEVSFSERMYQNVNISELTADGKTFTYYLDNNVLVGSFTSFLVEDVVRLVNNDFRDSFKRVNRGLFNLPKLSNDDGDIYLNMEMASLWLSSFVKADHRQKVKAVREFSHSSFFDVALADHKIFFNGFTISNTKEDYLSTLQDQKPVRADVAYLIPNRTAFLYQFGLSDAVSWHKRLIAHWKQKEAAFLEERKTFEQDYGFSFSEFYAWIGMNVDLVQLESSRRSGTEKLTIIHSKDITEALNQLNTFSEALAQVHGDSVYVESFSVYELRELKMQEFPRLAFGPLFAGYEECYFTAIDNYIVIANSMLTLKSLIEDVENENTWGRSVVFNTFLESNLQESNLSLVFNTRRVWQHLMTRLDPKWRQFGEKYATSIKRFGLGSVQFSRLDENFYTSITLQYDEQWETNEDQSFEILRQTSLDHKIITKPHVVRHHTTRDLEVILQDSSYNLILIGEDGNVLWKDSIGQPIISDIEQIDYYNNGNLQYFFATGSALHVIDRLGNYVDGYPAAVSAKLKYASVVDYDNSKRYRFLLADQYGNLYLYDKEGVNLEGWTPRKITGKLGTKPFHLRVRGRDCIVAIQQDGIVNIMNRRGEMMPGFPLKLDARIETTPFVHIGSDFNKTIITVLSNEGRLINFNLLGTIVSTEQLYKPTKETTYTLIPDALGKTYLIARQDMARLALITPRNEEVLSKDYLSSEMLQVQYYDFSSDHKIYAITDKSQRFTYLYDKSGKLINSTPINSEHMIGLMYFESTGEHHVYTTFNNSFRLLTF